MATRRSEIGEGSPVCMSLYFIICCEFTTNSAISSIERHWCILEMYSVPVVVQRSAFSCATQREVIRDMKELTALVLIGE